MVFIYLFFVICLISFPLRINWSSSTISSATIVAIHRFLELLLMGSPHFATKSPGKSSCKIVYWVPSEEIRIILFLMGSYRRLPEKVATIPSDFFCGVVSLFCCFNSFSKIKFADFNSKISSFCLFMICSKFLLFTL